MTDKESRIYLFHQITAAIFLPIITVLFLSVVGRSGWVSPMMQVQSLFAIVTVTPLFAGILIGVSWPDYGRLGYWVWLLPSIPFLTLAILSLIQADLDFLRFLTAGPGDARPQDGGPAFWAYFCVQSIAYVLGLRAGVGFRAQKAVPRKVRGAT